jgi:hypothetical protein
MNQAKLFARNVFDDMVERKLWPVGLILLVALIAIPVVLSKPASESTTPLPGAAETAPAVSGASSPLTAFEPVVSSSVATGESKGLRGRVKNPFSPKGIDFSAADDAGSVEPIPGLGNAAVSTGETAVGAGDTAPPSDSGQTGSGGGSGAGGKKYFTYTAKVRFGEEGDTTTRTLSEFRSLPSSDNPIAVFMGVKTDGKTAVFLMSSSTTTTGDGDCEPTDSECTFLYLKAGDAQLIETVTPEGEIVSYELELVDISVKETDGPKNAAADGAGASKKARGSKAKSRRAQARNAARALHRLPF